MQQTERVAVCGAGTMGSGIAQVAAMAGFTTQLLEVQPAFLEKAMAMIRQNLDRLVQKNRLSATAAQEAFERIEPVVSAEKIAADLVIEAIIEQIDAKIALFAGFMQRLPAQTLYATNTSSISVTQIAEKLVYPDRLIGLHFFNPAPLMKLVEVISTRYISPETIAQAIDLVQQFGKTPVSCKDAPGFIVNRVARPYYLESLRQVESGSISPEELDNILEATGFKMGPFRLMDLIGMDINLKVSELVWEALDKPERLHPSPLQAKKVAEGKLGQKTGEGFYRYQEEREN
ncbi:MAG TPA: 3-hydroxyacyl-CoA dehydrogenase NAD-binding domain-containing protein [Sediminibacterium sp.]|nr:3-hydroxyacyl-CoA dehydrogenase NAD-binding domain-containing protein [Sediminibacterium sp.]